MVLHSPHTHNYLQIQLWLQIYDTYKKIADLNYSKTKVSMEPVVKKRVSSLKLVWCESHFFQFGEERLLHLDLSKIQVVIWELQIVQCEN